MKEKKQQENDEIVREPETDKKSCQQDVKECSEEKVETTENDKSAEETIDSEGMNPDGTTKKITESSDQNSKSEDTLNNQDRREVSDDGDIKKKIHEMLGKEVTWTAVAALGGAIIVIWNIIRYIFIWVSSFLLYTITNVPRYLLEQRKNVGFTNLYLAYFTALIVIMIISFTKYNILPEEMAESLQKFLQKIVKPYIIIVILSLVGFFFLIKCDTYSDLMYIIGYYYVHVDLFLLGYVTPFIYMLVALSLGFERYQLRKLDSLVDGLLYFYKKDIENKNPNKEIEDWFKALKEQPEKSNNTFKATKKLSVHIICVMIFCSFFMCSINTYQLVDQYNRVIVADLGEHYIVQEAQYDTSKKKLIVDNSFYYVIDADGEKVSMIRAFYTPIK